MSVFKFRQFDVRQSGSAMKIGTDAMVFGAFVDTANRTNALDVGTGTGVLSLMVAQKNPALEVHAVEIEPNAYEEAKFNFEASLFKKQLTIHHEDFLRFSTNTSFDLIFSNPPYFENSSKSGLEVRDLARHDDHLPLHKLFGKVSQLLAEHGRFWLILPHLTMDQYYPEAAIHGLYPETEISVYGKKDQLVRKITAFSRMDNKTVILKELVIRNGDGTYTDAYKLLTKAYHFNIL